MDRLSLAVARKVLPLVLLGLGCRDARAAAAPPASGHVRPKPVPDALHDAHTPFCYGATDGTICGVAHICAEGACVPGSPANILTSEGNSP